VDADRDGRTSCRSWPTPAARRRGATSSYGDGKVGERLIQDENVDCVGFVGSHTTAEKIVRAAGLKRSLIEASGNGPGRRLSPTPTSRPPPRALVFGGFFCAGQVCCATERVLVDERIHDDVPRTPWSRRPRAGAWATRSTTTRWSAR
jgi:acyl-CoA reductase-like NAD-dependent aldehyde dehydrogenase